MNLTDDEREHIRLDEECRYAARENIGASHTPSRLWRLLNSGFVLWLLSAVVVSGIARWQTIRESEQKRIATLAALDSEIAYRLSTVLRRLYEIQATYCDDVSKHDSEALIRQKQTTAAVLHELYSAPVSSSPSLYPEYSRFGLLALATDLIRTEHDPAAQTAIIAVRKALTRDAALANEDSLPPANWAQKIIQYRLPRWTREFEISNPFEKDPPNCD